MAVASSSTDQPSPEKVSEYRAAIENHGDIDSMYKLASLLSRGGDNVKADTMLAIELYKRAITEGNHLPSMLNLASLLHRGYENNPPNVRGAIEIYELAIEEYDDAVALCRRALLTLEDNNRTIDDEERALDYLQRSADKGYANAIGELGLMHHVGWGSFTKDLSKAANLFRKAIDLGRVTNSMYYLAFIVLEGYDDIPPDPNGAIHLLQQAIDEGNDTDAMVFLAKILRDGQNGVEKDLSRATELLQRAVKEEHSAALFHLGCLYLSPSDESIRDVHQAVNLFSKAISKHNDQHAAFKLALLYKDGFDEEPPNARKAAELFQIAVNSGNHIQSMLELALLLDEGAEGLPKDVEKSMKLLRQLDSQIQVGPRDVDVEAANLLIYAAEKGNSCAETLVGIHYKFGDEPFGLDKPKALDMLRNAANAGNSEAMFHMGMMLLDGASDEIESDTPGAMNLFKRAADDYNNLAAINVLASFLLEGYRDIPADVEEAVKYLEKAIQLGDTHSMNRLGMLHFEGYLLPSRKNLARAVTLFRQAIDVGDVNAAHNLAILERNGTFSGRPNPKEAVKLLENAIEKRRHFRSMIVMTDLLVSGWEEVGPNLEEASTLIEEAIEMGDLDGGNLHAALRNAGYEDGDTSEMIDEEEDEEEFDDEDSVDYRGRSIMFKEAILRGDNPIAYYALGCLVQESQADICADVVGAARWFQRAVDINGHALSALNLANMYLQGEDEELPQDVERAKILLKSAAEHGNSEAASLLSSLS